MLPLLSELGHKSVEALIFPQTVQVSVVFEQGIARESVIGGDLLELNQVTIDDPDRKGTWLFAAPPGFVVRPDGSVIGKDKSPNKPR